MSCKSCNTLNNSCSCNSDTVSSDKVTYMGDKFVCTHDGEQKFVLKPCESVTKVINTLATQVCTLFAQNTPGNMYIGDGTITDDVRTVTIPTAGTNGKLLFGPELLTIDKKNGITGVGTDNPFVDQVGYASNANYASRFVVRTADDRYGLNHNNGTIELASYIINTAGAYWGTVSSHDYILMTGDTARAVIDTNGNLGVGEFTPTARVHIKGVNALNTSDSLTVVNSADFPSLNVQNDGAIGFGLLTPASAFHHFRSHNGFGVRVEGHDQAPNVNSASAYAFRVYNASAAATYDLALQVRNNGRLDVLNNTNIGDTVNNADTRLYVKGIDATASNYALKVADSTTAELLTVRNDSFVAINGATQGTTEVFGVQGNGKISGGVGLLGADFTSNKGINMPANQNMMAIANITIFSQVSNILKLTMNTTNQFDFARTDGNVIMSLIHTTRDLTDLFLDSEGVNAANPSANTRVSFNSSYAGDTNLRKLAYVEHAITNDTTGDSNITINIGGVEVARFDESATAGDTKFMIYDVDNATLERVTVGAADSGGVGFKLLRIPN